MMPSMDVLTFSESDYSNLAVTESGGSITCYSRDGLSMTVTWYLGLYRTN